VGEGDEGGEVGVGVAGAGRTSRDTSRKAGVGVSTRAQYAPSGAAQQGHPEQALGFRF